MPVVYWHTVRLDVTLLVEEGVVHHMSFLDECTPLFLFVGVFLEVAETGA